MEEDEISNAVVPVPIGEIVPQCSEPRSVVDSSDNAPTLVAIATGVERKTEAVAIGNDDGTVVAIAAGVERKTEVVAIGNDDGIVAAAIVTENTARAKIAVATDDVGAAEDVLVREKIVQAFVQTDEGIVCGVSRVVERISASQVRLRRTVIPVLYGTDWDAELLATASPEQETESSGCRKIVDNVIGDLKNLRDKCCKPSDRWTTNLKKARNFALKMLGSIVFPLFLDVVRDVWVAIEFILALVGLGLSIATLSLDHNAIFNILHLTLAISSFTLSLLDLVFNRRCKSCKCCPAQNRAAEYDMNEDKKCCKKCFLGVKKTTDVLRALVAEILIYPLLMCNLLGVITGRGYTGESGASTLNFTLFVLSCFSLILYVYAVRILVMVKVITGSQHIGRSKQEWLDCLDDQYDPSLGRSNFCYQIWFLMNMMFLMIIQVLMIVAIGMKMYEDNQHFYKEDNTDENIRVTPVLWYMMACGYVAPFLGFLSYLLITLPWARDFFLGIFYNVASLWKFWKKGGIDDLLPGGKNKKKEGDDTEELDITSEKELRFLRYFVSFKQDFEKYRKMRFCHKVAYPFTTIIVFPFCVLYTWMQVFFTGFAAISAFELSASSPYWLVLYLTTVPIAGLFSTHIFIIGFMWSMLLYAVIHLIAFAVVFSPFIFLYYLQRSCKL